MSNINEKDVCNIVRDLLPLYADDACNESSRRLVEAHIKSCSACSDILNAMKQPIAVDEQQVCQGKAIKKAARRLKLRTILIFILVIAIVLPPAALMANQIRNDGLCFTNADDILVCSDVMKLWKLNGFDIAVQEMNPEIIKEGLSQSLLETRYLGVLKYNPDAYKPQDINGETYYVVDGMFTSTVQGSREFRKNFWYNIVTQTSDNYLIPSDIYNELVNKYGKDFAVRKYERDGNWEDSTAKKISTACGDFYVNYSEDEIYTTEFDDDMKDKVPGMYELDELFCCAGNTCYLTPEVYEYYKKTYNDVVKWYEEYAAYYSSMRTEEFVDNWRNTLLGFIEGYEKKGITLTDYKYKSVFRNQNGAAGWNVEFEVIFSNGAQGTVFLHNEDGNCFIYGAVPDYENPESTELLSGLDNLFPDIYVWSW